jgi:hypothetical protein
LENLKHPAPDDIIIDITNEEELLYIATKFGCTTEYIVLAIETTGSKHRVDVYDWLIATVQQPLHESTHKCSDTPN